MPPWNCSSGARLEGQPTAHLVQTGSRNASGPAVEPLVAVVAIDNQNRRVVQCIVDIEIEL